MTAPRPHRWRNRTLLAAGSVLVTALGCEIGARIFAWRSEVHAMEAWQRLREPRQQPTGDANLFDIIRLAQDPRIVYELIPNLTFRFFGQPVRTNASGFRSPPVDARSRTRTRADWSIA